MGDRTSPEDAAERIAWELNFHKGEEISLNELADLTDLSWATVRKYTQLIETLQKVTPEIDFSGDGVYSGERSEIVHENLSEPERALAVYLLLHAELSGEATAEVSKEELTSVVENSNTLTKMEQLGWINSKENNVHLTPLGVKIAGKARSEVLSSKNKISKESEAGWKSKYNNSGTSADSEQQYEINDSAADNNRQEESRHGSGDIIISASAI